MTQSPLYAPDRSPTPRKLPPQSRRSPSFGWLIGGVLATLALVPQEQLSQWLAPLAAAPHAQQQSAPNWSLGERSSTTCQEVLNKDQRLSRDQLSQFLTIAKGTTQATIHGTIAPPHCRLSKSHQAKQHEAYPMAFDPDTWFVVNYDQGNYTDYSFVFQK